MLDDGFDMVLAQREDARYGLTCEEHLIVTFRQ
jgi:hypothetical protein